MKTCNRCLVKKPVDKFPAHTSGAVCRDCRASYLVGWRARRPGYNKARARRLEASGLCEVCASMPRVGGKKCLACVVKQKASQAKYKARRIASGGCPYCSDGRLEGGKKICVKCAAKSATRIRTKWRNCPEMRARNKDTLNKLRLEVFMAYGGAHCACCGEAELVFLTLDHLESDGAAHRRRVGGGYSVYRWAKKHGYPKRFQVLCWNCNEAKRIVGGCPHGSRGRNGRQETPVLRLQG